MLKVLKIEVVFVFLLLIIIFFVFNRDTLYLSNFPSFNKISGEWIITDESLLRLSNSKFTNNHIQFSYLKKSEHQIILNRDNTCLFKTYLSYDQPIGKEQEKKNYINGKLCSWRMSYSNKQRFLFEKKIVTLNIYLESRRFNRIEIINVLGAVFNIAKLDNKLILWSYLNDPDKNQKIIFERTVEQKD